MLLDRYWKIEEELFPKNFFYRHSKLVAPDLIGCNLIKKNNEIDQVKGVIVETEAYSQEEEACHGYRKMTKSNKSLFGKPGTFYIYKSYGIHHCLNIVTDKENFASGVLIRSVFISNENERLASGPGLVTKPGPEANLSFLLGTKTDLINTPLAKFSLSVTMFKQWWIP